MFFAGSPVSALRMRLISTPPRSLDDRHRVESDAYGELEPKHGDHNRSAAIVDLSLLKAVARAIAGSTRSAPAT